MGRPPFVILSSPLFVFRVDFMCADVILIPVLVRGRCKGFGALGREWEGRKGRRKWGVGESTEGRDGGGGGWVFEDKGWLKLF